MAVTVGNLALTMVQETDGINCRPGTPIIRPHLLTDIFFAKLHKKGPAGSEKQVINLVWP